LSVTQQIVHDLLNRFPNAGSRALGRKAFSENKSVFPTMNAAYLAIRKVRGSQGKAHRKWAADKSKFGTTPACQGFEAMPEGLTHFDDWGLFEIAGDYRAGVLSDTHIPYHSKTALITALREIKKRDCNLLILNGDIADFFSVSMWEKDPRKRRFAEELKTVRDFLDMTRKAFPKARIIYKVGNHEERWERYMRVKAPELLDVAEFETSAILGLDKLGIELVGDKRPIRLNSKFNLIHGHEFRFAIAGPVNPARGFFNRAKSHCLGGHFHQTSQHSEKNIEQNVVSTWSTGCLCDLSPDYMPLNQWNHGFAIVETDRSGAFQVSNHRIIDGGVW